MLPLRPNRLYIACCNMLSLRPNRLYIARCNMLPLRPNRLYIACCNRLPLRPNRLYIARCNMLRAVRRKVCRSIDRWMDKGSFGAAENDSVAQRSGNVTGVNSRIMTWIMRWHSSDSRRYRSLNSFWSTSSCNARAAVGYRAGRPS